MEDVSVKVAVQREKLTRWSSELDQYQNVVSGYLGGQWGSVRMDTDRLCHFCEAVKNAWSPSVDCWAGKTYCWL